MNKKLRILLTVAAALLLVIGAVSGTVAYLTATDDPVVNTFTTSNITVDIDETKREYKIIPGTDIPKDPKVTATGDIDYYVFVKIEANPWPENGLLTYEIDREAGWLDVTGYANVYYQPVTAKAEFKDVPVLKGNKVVASVNIGAAEMTAMAANAPVLTLTPYACQQAKGSATFAPEEAWAMLTTPPAADGE